MKANKATGLCLVGLFLSNLSWAQAQPVPVPMHRVTLSATAAVELPQDWLTLTLATTRQGREAAAVQAELTQAVEAALSAVRPQAAPEQLVVRTGAMGLTPRYGRDGVLTGWQGRAELVLEGRDFARITQAAAKAQSLSLQGMFFGLSPAARQALEGRLQAQALARFQERASQAASSLGFSGFKVVEVQLGSVDDHQPPPRPRMLMAMEAKSIGADAALPAEAGLSTVQLSVSGTVALH